MQGILIARHLSEPHLASQHSGDRGKADLKTLKLEASLVYRASSRTARATQRNPVSEKQEREGEGGGGFDFLYPREVEPTPGFRHWNKSMT